MATKTKTYAGFDSWAEVLNWCGTGLPIFYQAPMDVRPVTVTTSLYGRTKNRIRVYPPTTDADPFVADAAHLSRFRRETHEVLAPAGVPMVPEVPNAD